MENTLENKEKFFAAHWGQNVYCRATINGFALRIVNGNYLDGNVEPDHLLFTDIKDITDEDAVEVAVISDYTPKAEYGKEIICGILGREEFNYGISFVRG